MNKHKQNNFISILTDSIKNMIDYLFIAFDKTII